jgi:hypothetical protein
MSSDCLLPSLEALINFSRKSLSSTADNDFFDPPVYSTASLSRKYHFITQESSSSRHVTYTCVVKRQPQATTTQENALKMAQTRRQRFALRLVF